VGGLKIPDFDKWLMQGDDAIAPLYLFVGEFAFST
jgi:hypothetical protein